MDFLFLGNSIGLLEAVHCHPLLKSSAADSAVLL
jgi:hypothetical protein